MTTETKKLTTETCQKCGNLIYPWECMYGGHKCPKPEEKWENQTRMLSEEQEAYLIYDFCEHAFGDEFTDRHSLTDVKNWLKKEGK